jgi:hypothetical protein
MRLVEVEDFFRDSGLPLHWLADAGQPPMKAMRTGGATLDLSVEAAVVIPDVHLSVGRDDSFQEKEPGRVTRFERFLDVLAALRDKLGAPNFAAVQLGDFYDVMRTLTPWQTFEKRLAVVFDAYPSIVKRAQALPLLHCIGNHDHELFENRATLGALGINAHIARAIGPGVLAFHGNNLVSLRTVNLDINYQMWLLSLVQGLVEMPVGGELVSALQHLFDESLEDPIFANAAHTSLAWPPAGGGANRPEGWDAPWVVRESAAQLGEPLLDWENTLGKELKLAIIGHSHRPGIGWAEVAIDQRIPVVDVGSWTYGRTNFAVVCSDGVGVATLGT